MKPARLILGALLAFVAATVLAVGFVFAQLAWDTLRHGPGPTDPQAVEREAQRVYDAIVVFHWEHGRYPKSLSEIGVDPDSIGWGGWDYDRAWFSDSFELSLGNYDRYNFVMWRDESDTEWGWDR